MGLTTYVMLLFGISIALFFLGSKPMLFNMMECTDPDVCDPSVSSGSNVVNNILDGIINNAGIISLALAGTASQPYRAPPRGRLDRGIPG